MQQTHNLLILGSSPSGPTTLLLRLDIVRYNNRTVAQPGSASALGAEGRRFESSLSDHFIEDILWQIM